MKLIYILLLFTLLAGCKVKKDLSVKSELLTEQREQKDIEQTEQVQTEITAHRETEAETVIEGITVTYDTEKPADPQTGKPPVKSETKWKKETKEKGNEQAAQTIQKDTHTEDKSRTDIQHTEKVDVVQSQKKDVFRVPWFWVCAGIIGCGGILFWYSKKHSFRA